jgi:formylglycine-generating enzyme required for sulfatase activity
MAWDDEKPQHTPTIPYDYWIGRLPVTNAQFGESVRSTSSETRAQREGWWRLWNTGVEQWEKTKGASWKHPVGADSSVLAIEEHPVVQVCWYDALFSLNNLGFRVVGAPKAIMASTGAERQV